MRIAVVISGWEQGCCGTPFTVGDHVTWQLLASAPAGVPEGTLPRFEEEHHDQTPDGVPHWDVSGVVAAIKGVRYPLLPVTGQVDSFTWDTEHPQVSALGSVEGPADPRFDEYQVLFDVADDAGLPPYAPGETLWQGEVEASAEKLIHERRHDGIGVLLEALADRAQNRYGKVASMTRASGMSAVSIVPHRSDATAIRWARSSEDDDEITVSVGDGTWRLPASVAGADRVGEFLDAAADGRVEEHVRQGEGKKQHLVTEIHALDGRTWTAATEYEPFEAGNGVFAVVGPLWVRVQRGSHRYQPWER